MECWYCGGYLPSTWYPNHEFCWWCEKPIILPEKDTCKRLEA